MRGIIGRRGSRNRLVGNLEPNLSNEARPREAGLERRRKEAETIKEGLILGELERKKLC